MIPIERRKSDILKLTSKLDISPTMHKDAVEKYKNISDFLNSKGINADFYPQGSFALGTVVRPYRSEKEGNFDLDAICQIRLEKHQTTPEEIKTMVENAFENDGTYKDKLEVFDQCCTINYAESNNISFSIDIVSAVDEDLCTKQRLSDKSQNPEYIGTAIAISSKENGEYEWGTNNPKGFKKWFDEINILFLEANPLESRESLFKSHKHIFASVEDIPLDLERTALQRVIQIFKRHRDVYFGKSDDKKALKPHSGIINVLVSMIASGTSPDLDVFDLLGFVVDELNIYSRYQILSESEFRQTYSNKSIIRRTKGAWILENPVNPEDNLVDSWNVEPKKAQEFFAWLKMLSEDFAVLYSGKNEQFLTMVEGALGSDFVRDNLDTSKYSTKKAPTLISNRDQSKPWGAN